MSKRPWWLRQRNAQALAQMGPSAVEPLIRFLKDDDLRDAATQALVQIGPPAVEPLIRILGDGNRDVRQATAKALMQLGEDTFAGAVLAALDGKPQALAKLKDPRAVEPLIHALDNGYNNVCQAAAHALGQLGDLRAVEPLIRALKDSNVRDTATQALVQIGSPSMGPLIGALGDGDKDVRQAAAQSLGQLGDTNVMEPLIHVLGNRDNNMRQAATQAIRTFCENNQRLLGSNCVCIEHLNRFSLQQVSLSAFEKTGYYACRTCRADQPRYETVLDVVLVLDDRAADPSPVQQENVLYIPWSLARGIFDFNIVEIRAADSSNIERFLVQFEEDTDPARPWKLESAGKPSCRVSPGCILSPADRARLQRHFEIVDGAT